MISHAEAQELHEKIGAAIAITSKEGSASGWELGRAREIAAIIVSDTEEPQIPDWVSRMDGLDLQREASRVIGEDRCDRLTLEELVAQFGEQDG